ncbi:MAG: DUF1840 domain-containing protein [Burkholderiales bacterium]|nr:DUF1840 domain-containing protein [Nitrosomonas sp.]MCP5275369.1 DUF1840 domain-containing protein [Burkholderiales bacterium]
MLVTFKTDVGNIAMFGDVALQMIKMMGHSETIPGAILAEDLPQALSRLKNALANEKAPPPTDKDEDDDDKEPAISTTHRAIPLINLLTEAIAADCDLMWE